MNKTISILCSAVLLGLIVIPVHSISGQTAGITTTPVPVTTTTLSTSGNISEVSPDEILVKTQGVPDPVPYLTTKDTTYVDDQEAPVPMDKVKVGHAVIIYYVMDGKNRVASKIVVRNAP